MKRRDNPVISGIISFIGIDYNLLKRSGEDNIAKFYLSGFFVLLIFALSFFSVFYAFDLMFHKWYAEFLLATFFSFTFLTIYLLLIQTFSKETLPSSYKVTIFSTSNITRASFVFLISLLIAQPIKVYILKDQLNRDIVGYRSSLMQGFLNHTRQLYQKDLVKLNQEKLWYEQLDSNEELPNIQARIDEIESTMEQDKNDVQLKIAHSDFFLKRIELAGKYPSSWLTCLAVIVIFSIPVYLIYSISDNSRYYTEKRNYDHDIVLNKYEEFKKRYTLLFKERYNKDIQYVELYEDPPFNKIKKPAPIYLKSTDLAEKVMNNEL